MPFAYEKDDIVTLKGFLPNEPRQRFAVVVRRLHEESNGQFVPTYGCRLMDRFGWRREQRVSWGPTLGLGLHEFFERELVAWEDVPKKEGDET